MTGCGTRSISLWVHRNFFWQLSRDTNLHGSGMPLPKTASECPKPPFRASWRVCDIVVSRGNAWWTTSKSGHFCPSAHARTAHKGLLQKRLEEDLCWIFPHVSTATQSVKGLHGTELIIYEENGSSMSYSSFFLRFYTYIVSLHISIHSVWTQNDVLYFFFLWLFSKLLHIMYAVSIVFHCRIIQLVLVYTRKVSEENCW